jgi:hypothetical protein
MNPQNPNDNQQQQIPPAGYPGVPNQNPSPQIYGPQQYSPMPVSDTGLPGPAPKSKKKLIIIGAIVLGAVLLIAIIAAVFANLRNGGGPGKRITRAYDSPAGLVPGMQSAQVQSGKFKFTASYVTGGNFTREGTFSVKDGHLYFDMVTDDGRVNELMKYLYTKRGAKVPFDVTKHGVSRSLTYDFASLMGYHYLYDQNGGEQSGFIPEVEAAKSATKPNKLYTLTTTCDAAFKDVKERTDMSTTNLIFETAPEGVNKTKAVVSFATRQAINKAVVKFFDSCYDLKQPGAAKLSKFVDGLRQDIAASPTFTYWQEEGVNYLDISAPASDTPFGGSLHFELTGLSSSAGEQHGATGSYVERRNQFGLTYSLCRVDPVVTTTQTTGYRFLREDPAYRYPSVTDTGYYCTTLAVPSQFKPTGSMTLRTTTGVKTRIVGASLEGLRGLHDLVYEVEKFNLGNKRYPGPLEFRDIANSNMGGLTGVTQSIFTNKSLVYTPAPSDCVGTCNDFVLSYVPAPNVQVRRTTYKP